MLDDIIIAQVFVFVKSFYEKNRKNFTSEFSFNHKTPKAPRFSGIYKFFQKSFDKALPYICIYFKKTRSLR